MINWAHKLKICPVDIWQINFLANFLHIILCMYYWIFMRFCWFPPLPTNKYSGVTYQLIVKSSRPFMTASSPLPHQVASCRISTGYPLDIRPPDIHRTEFWLKGPVFLKLITRIPEIHFNYFSYDEEFASADEALQKIEFATKISIHLVCWMINLIIVKFQVTKEMCPLIWFYWPFAFMILKRYSMSLKPCPISSLIRINR